MLYKIFYSAKKMKWGLFLTVMTILFNVLIMINSLNVSLSLYGL